MTISATLLLCLLCGGYLFGATFYPSTYNAARESGHKLYFRAVFYSIFLAVTAIFSYILYYSSAAQSSLPIGLSPVELILQLLNSTQRNNLLIWAIAMAPSSFLLNTLFHIPRANLKLHLLRTIVRNRDFERLILRALDTSIPLLITLESQKLYVGWAVRAIDPTEERMYVRILPLISGYRSNHDHKINFTTFYDEIIEEIGQEIGDLSYVETQDLEVVIPIARIMSIHLFDLKLYDHFRESPEETEVIAV